MNNTMMSEKQLINKYRKILTTVADADIKTKALVLKMSMRSDNLDDAIINNIVNSILEEQETASDIL